MEKIELLEKLVEVQEEHIELMQDFANLQGSLKSLEEVKNGRINDLLNKIEQQAEKIETLEVKNRELNKQVEELQNSIISVEDCNEQNQ